MRIVRDHGVCPGGESWLVLVDEMVFVTSAEGVSAEGAASLEACWAWYIDQGVWRWRAGGQPLSLIYHRVPALDDDYACVVTTTPGQVECLLSAEHFSRGTANGLYVAARDCVRSGWSYYAPTGITPETLVG